MYHTFLKNIQILTEMTFMKKCRNCHIEKNFSDFWKDRSRSDGHGAYCKVCRLDFQRNGFPHRESRHKDGMVKCKTCKVFKDKSEFYIRSNGRVYSYCNECNLVKRRARTVGVYGLSLDEYDAMLAEQENLCKICRNPGDGKNGNLVIDHNHNTGAVRGLLCNSCNVALGNAKDSVEILQKMIEYLQK